MQLLLMIQSKNMIVTWSATSHYLNQCWNIVNWTPRNKLQWNFNRNSYIFIQENPFENVVWKMAAMLSRSQCVKMNSTKSRQGRVQMHGLYSLRGIHLILISRSNDNWSYDDRIFLTFDSLLAAAADDDDDGDDDDDDDDDDCMCVSYWNLCLRIKLTGWGKGYLWPGPLFNKRTGVFSQDLVKSRNNEIQV